MTGINLFSFFLVGFNLLLATFGGLAMTKKSLLFSTTGISLFSFLLVGFNPNALRQFSTYSPAGYKFFPGRLTGTVGMDFQKRG